MLTVGRHTFPTLLSRTDRISHFPVMGVCEKVETSTGAGPSGLMNSLWSHTNCGRSRGLLYSCPTHVIITMIFDYGALSPDFDTI